MYDIIELSRKLLPDLKEIAKELKISKVDSYKKQDLIYKILDTQAILASERKSVQSEDKKSPKGTIPIKDQSKKESNKEKENAPEKDRPKRRRRTAVAVKATSPAMDKKEAADKPKNEQQAETKKNTRKQPFNRT